MLKVIKNSSKNGPLLLNSILYLVYALYNMAYSIGMFIGPVIAGLIMSAADFKTLMFVFGIALLVCTPIMMDWIALYKKMVAYMRRH